MRAITRRHVLAVGAMTAVAAWCCAGNVHAQPKPAKPPQPAAAPAPQQPSGPPNALQGFSQNRTEPVKINAASLEVRDKNKVATFSGDVKLVQGDTTMRCKTLVVYYDADNNPAGANPAGAAAAQTVKSATPGPNGSSQIRRMEALGNVLVTQKDQTATGERAVYDTKENTVRLFAPTGGMVAVTQGPNVMQGATLVVHLDTGVSHFEGGVIGLINPNSTKGGGDTKSTPADTRPAPKAQPGNPKGLY